MSSAPNWSALRGHYDRLMVPIRDADSTPAQTLFASDQNAAVMRDALDSLDVMVLNEWALFHFVAYSSLVENVVWAHVEQGFAPDDWLSHTRLGLGFTLLCFDEFLPAELRK